MVAAGPAAHEEVALKLNMTLPVTSQDEKCNGMLKQGRPQDLAGGAKIFFFRFGNLHVARRHASPCALLGGFEGMPPTRNFFKMVHFGAFWCIFLSDFVLKKI